MADKVNVGGIILDTAILDKITQDMRPKAARIIEKYGFAITIDAATKAPYDTGALQNSITAESKMDVGELTFTIQDGVTYGIFQELGTSKMRARPFLIPALEHWAQRFINEFAELFKS